MHYIFLHKESGSGFNIFLERMKEIYRKESEILPLFSKAVHY